MSFLGSTNNIDEYNSNNHSKILNHYPVSFFIYLK